MYRAIGLSFIANLDQADALVFAHDIVVPHRPAQYRVNSNFVFSAPFGCRRLMSGWNQSIVAGQ
ncbi:hypothetical protein D9M72_595310 [compost metagenome]